MVITPVFSVTWSFRHYSKMLIWCCWKLCSSKVENSEEKTRRLRIRSSAEFLYSMTCVVICSHRRSHLKSFLQGIFIVRIGGGTFLGWDKTSKLRAINLMNPHLARTKSFADQRFNLSLVWLIDLGIIIETKAQLSSSNGQEAISNTWISWYTFSVRKVSKLNI